jgi:hypothetical protein
VTVLPCSAKAEDILAAGYDGIMLSNGPGDPTDNVAQIAEIARLFGRIPMFGICLGHQLMALAQGGSTVKLSSPGTIASVRPLSHFIWMLPASSTKSTTPSVPGATGAYGSFMELSRMRVPGGYCSCINFTIFLSKFTSLQTAFPVFLPALVADAALGSLSPNPADIRLSEPQ